MSIVLWIVGVLLVSVGIAGIIFPALPGHVLILGVCSLWRGRTTSPAWVAGR